MSRVVHSRPCPPPNMKRRPSSSGDGVARNVSFTVRAKGVQSSMKREYASP